MSRKNTLPYRVASAQSLAADFNSAPTLIRNSDNIGYQINITTTNSIGTFQVQGSNDYTVSEVSNIVTNPGNWVAIDLGGSPIANAANDTILIDLKQLPFNAVRIAYDSSTPGTGTCDIYILTKSVGA